MGINEVEDTRAVYICRNITYNHKVFPDVLWSVCSAEHPMCNRVRTLEESKGQLRDEDLRLRRGTCLGSWAVQHGASWLHWNGEEEREKKYQIPVQR